MGKKMVLSMMAVGILALGSVANAEVRVKSVAGIVRASVAGSEKFTQALPGQILAEGMEIRTGEDGRVAISLGPRNTVKLRGNSRMIIKTHREKVSRFTLLAGKLKGIFAGLTGGDRFELEFGGSGAVASVKGTVFTAEATPDGAVLHTIFGSMVLVFNGNGYTVGQGTGASMGNGRSRVRIYMLSERQIRAGLGRGNGRNRQRSSLRGFIRRAKAQSNADRDLVDQIHESDFAASRTLRDVHGNIARVDQRLNRPNPMTIEFINIVRRDSYGYAGKFSYNGFSGPRYDYMLGEVTFNMGLPDSLLDWPDFFSANGDYLDIVAKTVTLANGGPNDPTRDVIRTNFTSVSRPVIVGWDYVMTAPEVWTWVPQYSTEEFDIIQVNGRLVEIQHDAVQTDGEDFNQLWGTSVFTGKYLDDSNPATNVVTFNVEAYGINEDGGILSFDEVSDSLFEDPLGFFGSAGAEMIISVVDGDGFVFGGNGARPSNIDLVILPDIALAIAERYGPGLLLSDGFGD